MIVLILGLAGLVYGVFNLGMYRQFAGLSAVRPAEARAAKRTSVVGIAQPWDPPEPSPVTGAPVLWSESRRVTTIITGNSRGGAGTRTRNKRHGRIRTRFQVVDEVDGIAAVAVDGTKLPDTSVKLPETAYGARQSMTRIKEVALLPGTRVYVTGPLRDAGGYLAFGRGCMLQEAAPETRAAHHRQMAMLGGIGGVAGVLIGGVAVLLT